MELGQGMGPGPKLKHKLRILRNGVEIGITFSNRSGNIKGGQNIHKNGKSMLFYTLYFISILILIKIKGNLVNIRMQFQ
jgi:hypothetical protein